MRSRTLGLPIFGLLLVAGAAAAAPSKPDAVELSWPRAGQKMEIGGSNRFEISPGIYRDATKFDCTVTQGKTVWKSGDQPGPHCEMSAADQAKFTAGNAEVSVRAYFRKQWLAPAKATIELVPAAACSGPKCPGARAAAAAAASVASRASGGSASSEPLKPGERMPSLDGVGVGTADPKSWDSHYEGNGSSKGYLWCPGLWEMKSFDIKNGEVKFQVWIGAVGAQGQPRKAPSEDENAHLWVTGKIAADGSMTGGLTLSPATLAWVSAHPDMLPAGVTALSFTGKMKNENSKNAWTYDQGRVFHGAVTGGSAASCEFGAEAADFRRTTTPEGAKALAESGSSSPRSGGGSGGGGGGDACKKACQHTEATCTSSRGDCMKARQSCVSSCS